MNINSLHCLRVNIRHSRREREREEREREKEKREERERERREKKRERERGREREAGWWRYQQQLIVRVLAITTGMVF